MHRGIAMTDDKNIGQKIGNYELRELIGEGGMGEVYLAEQTYPIRRQVAIKIVKRGMDTAEFTERFESERQALALMDHPYIAKVFDAGATEVAPTLSWSMSKASLSPNIAMS